MTNLEIKNLKVAVGNKSILQGVNLTINTGKTNALMGPNGSGKSTLSQAIMGNPDYKITSGKILFNGEDITPWSVEKRAKSGIFLAFQYPIEVTGVGLFNFLRTAYNSTHAKKPLGVKEFEDKVKKNLDLLKMSPDFLSRNLNEGFSGGEKKRAEILQLAVLEPKIAILDETDSGLDIDSLKSVSDGIKYLVNERKKANNPLGILMITHYQRILKYIEPEKIYIMINGKIVDTGGARLAEKLEEEGYAQYDS